MAIASHAHPSARGLFAALLHSWPRPAPAPKRRRHYPPRRDRVIEEAAMAREMYRL